MSRLGFRILRNIQYDRPLKKEFDKISYQAFLKAARGISRRVKERLLSEMSTDDVLRSLIFGALKIDFGLTTEMANSAVATIEKYILDGLDIEVRTGGAGKPTRVFIDLSPDLEELPRVPGMHYRSEGGDVPWLYWLMTRGTTVVVEDYESVFTAQFDNRSRSGRGFMLQTGGSFRVDPRFAGTEFNNFITRLIDRAKPDIETIIKEEMVEAFQ